MLIKAEKLPRYYCKKYATKNVWEAPPVNEAHQWDCLGFFK